MAYKILNAGLYWHDGLVKDSLIFGDFRGRKRKILSTLRPESTDIILPNSYLANNVIEFSSNRSKTYRRSAPEGKTIRFVAIHTDFICALTNWAAFQIRHYMSTMHLRYRGANKT
uniref:LAGLIDADG homing endonuclease n=1 Tax=Romanomermis culicivorax TaxID=13658 RepID=A0A915KN37_ROMCU